MAKEKRRHPRLLVNLPVQAQVEGDVQALNVVDISTTGMQIRSLDFDKLKGGFDPHRNRAEFEMQIGARLAWVQNHPEGDFLTGWEFVLGKAAESRDVPVSDAEDDKRRHPRLPLKIPIRAQVGAGDYQDIELTDISPSGMQIRCRDFGPIKAGMDVHTNQVEFRLELGARLAWVQMDEDDEYITGWEFDRNFGPA